MFQDSLLSLPLQPFGAGDWTQVLVRAGDMVCCWTMSQPHLLSVWRTLFREGLITHFLVFLYLRMSWLPFNYWRKFSVGLASELTDLFLFCTCKIWGHFFLASMVSDEKFFVILIGNVTLEGKTDFSRLFLLFSVQKFNCDVSWQGFVLILFTGYSASWR